MAWTGQFGDSSCRDGDYGVPKSLDRHSGGRRMGDNRVARRASPAMMLRLVFAAAVAAALVLGYIGLTVYLRDRPGLGRSVADIIYYDLQLFVLDSAPVDHGGPYPVTLD